MLLQWSILFFISSAISYKIFSDKITVQLGKDGVQSIEKTSPITGKRSKVYLKKRGKNTFSLIKTEDTSSKENTHPYSIPEENTSVTKQIEGAQKQPETKHELNGIDTHRSIGENQPVEETQRDTQRDLSQNMYDEDSCVIIKTLWPVSEESSEIIRKATERETNGYLQHTYRRVFNGVSFCNVSDREIDKILKKVSNKRAYQEKNMKYALSYRQENLPDNFYILMNSHKKLFNVNWLDDLMNKYVRNGYIFRQSSLMQWYRNRYQPLLSKYTGKGVRIEIVDEDISAVHWEIEGRVKILRNKTQDIPSSHSTSVMTAAAGKTTGLAKESFLVLHPVFRFGFGYLSDILHALDKIAHDLSGKKAILLPFTGNKSDLLDRSLKVFYDADIPVVVSAGNNSGLSCNYSPARSKYAITVGSVTDSLVPERWTNIGSCTDAYAPGAATVGEIVDSSIGVHYTEKEGSSISAAYAIGYIAVMMESRNITVSEIREFLRNNQPIPLIDIPSAGDEKEIIYSHFRYNNIVIDALLVISPILAVVSCTVLFYRRRKTEYFTKHRGRGR